MCILVHLKKFRAVFLEERMKVKTCIPKNILTDFVIKPLIIFKTNIIIVKKKNYFVVV